MELSVLAEEWARFVDTVQRFVALVEARLSTLQEKLEHPPSESEKGTSRSMDVPKEVSNLRAHLEGVLVHVNNFESKFDSVETFSTEKRTELLTDMRDIRALINRRMDFMTDKLAWS